MRTGEQISDERRLLASELKDPTAIAMKLYRSRIDRRDDRRIEIGRKLVGLMKGEERMMRRNDVYREKMKERENEPSRERAKRSVSVVERCN